MRAICALLSTLAVFTLTSQVNAQSLDAHPPVSTLNANIELVLVPTVVTDKSGQHISDLNASDFSILQDKNKTPRIAFCEEVTRTSQVRPKSATLPPGVFSNVIGGDSAQRPKNVVVIAIDLINTPFSDQAYARKAVIKYLSESVSPDSLVALVFMTSGGVRMLHDFTADSATLIAALQKVTNGKARGGVDLAFSKAPSIATIDNEAAILSKFETEGYVDNLLKVGPRVSAHEIDFAHRNAMLDTTAALTQIANTYAAIPGRKSLVWVTSGLPLSIEFALAKFQQNDPHRVHETDVSADVERAWKALTDASFAVYAVDAEGLFTGNVYSGTVKPTGSVWNGGSPEAHVSSNDTIPGFVHQETFNTLETISNMTGGRAYLNTNDLAKSIHSAINDSESYYLIGFYLDDHGITPGWHPLKVSVNRKGVSVRSREGFIVSREPIASAERARADLMLALRSPVQFSALPMTLRWLQAKQAPTEPIAASSQAHRTSQTNALPNNTKRHIVFDLALASNAIQINDADSRAIHVDIVGVAQDETGDNVASIQQAINRKTTPEEAANLRNNGFLYKGALELAPGSYTIHLAVRDNLSGKLGSIIAPLKVEE